jgi:hypothetical protein
MTVSSVSKDRSPHRHKRQILVYQLDISGSSATVVGTTALGIGNNLRFSQSWIDGNTILAAYHLEGERLGLWAYPQGGDPKGHFRMPREQGDSWA